MLTGCLCCNLLDVLFCYVVYCVYVLIQYYCFIFFFFFFFFKQKTAYEITGVQTCALPISWRSSPSLSGGKSAAGSAGGRAGDTLRSTSSYCAILVRPATMLPSPTASRRRPARTSPLRTSAYAERAGDAATARHLPRARATGQGG